MIRRQGKKRRITLAARDAARRFTLRRVAKTNGWLPLVLRWRQRRTTKGPNVKADRARTSVTFLSFPQVHFHFVTHVSNANARRSVFRAATIHRERVVWDRSWTNTVVGSAQLRSAYHTTRIDYAREAPQPKPNVQKVELLSQRFFATIAKQFAAHRRDSFVSPVPATLRVNTHHEELTRLFKTYWRTYEHRSQVFSQRLPQHNSYALAGPTNRKQIQFDRPEELVWRRIPPPAVSEDVHHANTSESTQRQPVRIVETPAQQFSTPTGRTTQTQITKIDPALLDRLTDDVIRRVEKRARIERQRRGL